MSARISRRASSWLAAGSALGLLAGCGATRGDVQHPQPGEKGTPAYCASTAPDRNNCMACASKPGCGFCAVPVEGAPACQPGITGESNPTTCGVPLALNTEECAPPPPPAAE